MSINAILRSSLEDANPELVPPSESFDDVNEDVTVDAELDASEGASEMADVETAEQAYEAAEKAEETLESLYQALSYDIEHNGGVSQEAYPYMVAAYRGALSTLGVEHLDNTPAMEAFGGTSTRLQVSQEVLSTVKQWLAAAWKALVDLVVKVREYILKVWKRWMTTRGRMKANIEKLQKKIEKKEVKWDTQGKKDISASVARLITFDGQQVKFGELINKVKELMVDVRKLSTEQNTASAECRKAVVAYVTNPGANTGMVETIRKFIKNGPFVAERIPALFKKGGKEVDGDKTIYTSNEYGGSKFKFTLEKFTFAGEVFHKVTSSIERVEREYGKELKISLNQNEAKAFLTGALDVLKKFDELDAEYEKLEKEARELEGSKSVNIKDAELQAEEKENVRKALEFYRASARDAGKLPATVIGHATSILNAGMSVINKVAK